MNKIYWFEIHRLVRGGRWRYFWKIKCRNGRTKCQSVSVYSKKCLCINDAKSMADELNMEVRCD